VHAIPGTGFDEGEDEEGSVMRSRLPGQWVMAVAVSSAALLLGVVTVHADSYCNSSGSDGTYIYEEFDIEQDDCPNGAEGLDFEATNPRKDTAVRDWRIRIEDFDQCDTCARLDDYTVDVDTSGGWAQQGHDCWVYIKWYLDDDDPDTSHNQLALENVEFACDDGESTAATTVKAIPNHGWYFDKPAPHPGPEGDYYHNLVILNRELSGGDTLYLKDLKILIGGPAPYYDLASQINWSAVPTHSSFTARTLAPEAKVSFADIYSSGEPVDYVFFRLDVWNAANTAREFTLYVRHPMATAGAGSESVPTLSQWGMILLVFLVLGAGTAILMRGRMN
jgi:hypothetical protein